MSHFYNLSPLYMLTFSMALLMSECTILRNIPIEASISESVNIKCRYIVYICCHIKQSVTNVL